MLLVNSYRLNMPGALPLIGIINCSADAQPKVNSAGQVFLFQAISRNLKRLFLVLYLIHEESMGDGTVESCKLFSLKKVNEAPDFHLGLISSTLTHE